MPKTSDALKILDRLVGEDLETRESIDQEEFHAHIAQLIYDARQEAEMTQTQLAKLVGTSQPSIARLEDADYQGHSLTMLQRIAKALNKRLDISFAGDLG